MEAKISYWNVRDDVRMNYLFLEQYNNPLEIEFIGTENKCDENKDKEEFPYTKGVWNIKWKTK